MKLESGWCLKLGLLVFGCFFTLLGSVLVRHAEVFVQRHARRHRIAGLCYLAWLVAGFVDLVSPISINRAMYHLVLGVLGVTVTLTAAFDFRFHDRVRNVASGTLEKHATVTFSEMIEHSFYQGLNLAQILMFHALEQRRWTLWQRWAMLALVTAPWLFRSHFPVNSFSKNYHSVPLQKYSVELLLYRIKKWQYVFYKHALLHGLNVSVALSPSPIKITSKPLFQLYWLALNTSYVMEFFLQTLVKKGKLSQGSHLWLQRLLMSVSSIAAAYVLLDFVYLPIAEMEALQGRWVARAATCEALQEALQTRPAVLHISAHTFSARRLLLLEDGVSQAHELNVEQLEKMGPWKELGVLVLHCCGSQWLAEHLGCRALCCSEEVDDRAVCVFCRSFYLWLPEGLHTAFERAKNALGFGPDVGLRAEAKKFVLLPGKKDFSLGPCLGTGVAWPKLPRIQDYFCEVQTMLQIAAALSDEGRRRAILLLGGPGYGKTAFCREFGYHYSGPGRLFGNRVGFAGGQALSRSPQLAQDLEEMVRHGDERQLLVIDDVHLVEDKEGLRCALEGMLQRHHALRLLLTSRQMLGESWAMLDHGKVVQVHTPVLSTEDCAELFLRRSHRILRFGDFEEGGSKEVVERLKAKELLQSLDWLKALRHMPGRLVEWAAVVNTSLPSLLKHPFLASEAEARGKRW
ncbi:unnamed protein product [Effrenium voratum]|nr:unnamed protein product [Effrenium voratum]